MPNVLIFGTLFGAIVGLAHAWYVYANYLSDHAGGLPQPRLAVRFSALYFALWTLLLWMLFGTYVLALWIVSTILFALCKIFQRS